MCSVSVTGQHATLSRSSEGFNSPMEYSVTMIVKLEGIGSYRIRFGEWTEEDSLENSARIFRDRRFDNLESLSMEGDLSLHLLPEN